MDANPLMPNTMRAARAPRDSARGLAGGLSEGRKSSAWPGRAVSSMVLRWPSRLPRIFLPSSMTSPKRMERLRKAARKLVHRTPRKGMSRNPLPAAPVMAPKVLRA
jgi:hypothetical protein